MSDYISHHGILGMKWGVRRYQNKDGTLTAAGKKKYANTGTGKMGARPSNKNLSRNKRKAYDAADKADLLNGKAELAALKYGPNSKQFNKLSKQELKEYDKYKKYMKKDTAAKNRKAKIKDFFKNYANYVKVMNSKNATPQEKEKASEWTRTTKAGKFINSLSGNNSVMQWMTINNIQQQNAQHMINEANRLFMDDVHMNNMMNNINMMNDMTMHTMHMF